MKYKILGIVAVCAIALSSCRKYLDINENPNIALNSTPELLLPSAQIQIASALGVDLQIAGAFWGQHWTQNTSSSQYRYLEQYSPNAANYDRVWGLLYNGALTDLKQLELSATRANRTQYIGISKLLQAYTFQLLTDGWGDVPVAQALQGLPDQGSVVSPSYDPQPAVYDSIISLINQGMTWIEATSDQHFVSSDDVIYGGDMELWQRFGNTLLLRVYLRISEREAGKAEAGIRDLYNRTGGAMFLEEGQDAQVSYISTPGNQNPLFAEMVALSRTQNIVASATVADSMISNEDPRRFVFFTTVGGEVVGLQQGNFNSTTTGSLSTPTATTGALAADDGSAEAPVKFLTGYESYFLQAEATARFAGLGDAQDLFEQGIIANFRTYGLEEQDALDYIAASYWGQYPNSGDFRENQEHIITQKWFSMTGTQGYEAWNEWRRTGFPDFFDYSVTSIIGQNFPQRFLYPNTEVTRNANFPGQRTITDKVWWDVRD